MENNTNKETTKPKIRAKKQPVENNDNFVVEFKNGKKAVMSKKAADTLRSLGFIK